MSLSDTIIDIIYLLLLSHAGICSTFPNYRVWKFPKLYFWQHFQKDDFYLPKKRKKMFGNIDFECDYLQFHEFPNEKIFRNVSEVASLVSNTVLMSKPKERFFLLYKFMKNINSTLKYYIKLINKIHLKLFQLWFIQRINVYEDI